MPHRSCSSRRVLLAVAVLVACSSQKQASEGNDASAPSNLVAGPLGGGVHLTWHDNSSNEELFEIERSEDGSVEHVLSTVPFDTALYHDADVTFGVHYQYRVRAKLPSGYSGYSNQAELTLTAPTGAGGSTNGSSGAGGSTAVGGGSTTLTAGSGGTASGGQPSGGGSSAGGDGTGGTANGGSASGGVANGGTANGGSATGGTATGGAAPVSFSADIAPVLAASCASTTVGCHNADQAVGRIMPQFGPCKVIWFSAVDEPEGALYTSGPNQGMPTGCTDLTLYERLTTLHSMLCEMPTWDQRPMYVVPGDLNKSLLYQVIAGDPTMGGVCLNMGMPVTPMPKVDPMILPNPVPLTQAQKDKIRDWILQGAPDN